jgi:hypothetical protein
MPTPPEMTWRPIETAPKDGTRILTYCPKAPEYDHRAVRENYFKDGTWMLSNSTFWPPTHWMPLPTPPEGQRHGE